MNPWSKYKNFLFTSINYTGNKEIRIVVDKTTQKSFFCLDDILVNLSYVPSEDGSVQDRTIVQYAKHFKLFNFVELYPTLSFIPVDKVRLISQAAYKIRGIGVTGTNLIVSKCLNSFIECYKNRDETEIPSEIESFLTVGKDLFSVATFDKKTVVKATEIMKYCGYKDTAIQDNHREFSVKIKTKNGVANFIYLESFVLLANTMSNPKYSKKLLSLYKKLIDLLPKTTSDVTINKEKSVIVLDTNIIPFVVSEEGVSFQATSIQKMCGYKTDGMSDNFKRFSTKIQNIHYMTIEGITALLETRMDKNYKQVLVNLCQVLSKLTPRLS